MQAIDTATIAAKLSTLLDGAAVTNRDPFGFPIAEFEFRGRAGFSYRVTVTPTAGVTLWERRDGANGHNRVRQVAPGKTYAEIAAFARAWATESEPALAGRYDAGDLAGLAWNEAQWVLDMARARCTGPVEGMTLIIDRGRVDEAWG